MSEVNNLKKEIEALRAEIRASTSTSTRNITQQSMIPQIPPPAPPNIKDGDISENFRYFKQQWEVYITATGITHQHENTKKAILLTALGDEVFKRYVNMSLTESATATANALLDEIEKHLTPTVNKRYVRAIFNLAKQEPNESYDEYFNRLRGLIKNAEYGQLKNDILLDKIICSIKDHELREKLWLDSNITLEKAIEICRSKETTQKQIKSIENEPIEINKIQTTKKGRKEYDNSFSIHNTQCKFCGMEYHENLQQCKARNSICKSCNKKGHWARVCLSKNINQNKNRKMVKSTTTDSNNGSDSENEESVLHTFKEDNIEKGLYAKLYVITNHNKHCLTKCQLDTGATCNIIGLRNLKEIETTPLITETKTKLKIVEGPQVTPIGKTKIKIKHKNTEHQLSFYVIKSDHCPLLSLKTCQLLKLIEVCNSIEKYTGEEAAHKIIEKFEDVFQGLGKLKGNISLEIDKNITPRNEPPRRIPIALRKQLKATLEEMEKMDVITKEHEFTDWTSNLVLVRKHNKLRICIDPKHLNKALKDVKYQLPTIEEVLSELADAKVFSSLDAKHGFWQLPLDEKSSKLTSFWTPYGKYRFKRIPFGIKPAMEIFQMRQNQVISGLKGVVCIADDILVFGKGDNKETAIIDHNKNLEQLLKRLRKENLKINKDKIKICQKEIKFFGHILTSEGIKPDMNKISSHKKHSNTKKQKRNLKIFRFSNVY